MPIMSRTSQNGSPRTPREDNRATLSPAPFKLHHVLASPKSTDALQDRSPNERLQPRSFLDAKALNSSPRVARGGENESLVTDMQPQSPNLGTRKRQRSQSASPAAPVSPSRRSPRILQQHLKKLATQPAHLQHDTTPLLLPPAAAYQEMEFTGNVNLGEKHGPVHGVRPPRNPSAWAPAGSDMELTGPQVGATDLGPQSSPRNSLRPNATPGQSPERLRSHHFQADSWRAGGQSRLSTLHESAGYELAVSSPLLTPLHVNNPGRPYTLRRDPAVHCETTPLVSKRATSPRRADIVDSSALELRFEPNAITAPDLLISDTSGLNTAQSLPMHLLRQAESFPRLAMESTPLRQAVAPSSEIGDGNSESLGTEQAQSGPACQNEDGLEQHDEAEDSRHVFRRSSPVTLPEKSPFDTEVASPQSSSPPRTNDQVHGGIVDSADHRIESESGVTLFVPNLSENATGEPKSPAAMTSSTAASTSSRLVSAVPSPNRGGPALNEMSAVQAASGKLTEEGSVHLSSPTSPRCRKKPLVSHSTSPRAYNSPLNTDPVREMSLSPSGLEILRDIGISLSVGPLQDLDIISDVNGDVDSALIQKAAMHRALILELRAEGSKLAKEVEKQMDLRAIPTSIQRRLAIDGRNNELSTQLIALKKKIQGDIEVAAYRYEVRAAASCLSEQEEVLAEFAARNREVGKLKTYKDAIAKDVQDVQKLKSSLSSVETFILAEEHALQERLTKLSKMEADLLQRRTELENVQSQLDTEINRTPLGSSATKNDAQNSVHDLAPLFREYGILKQNWTPSGFSLQLSYARVDCDKTNGNCQYSVQTTDPILIYLSKNLEHNSLKEDLKYWQHAVGIFKLCRRLRCLGWFQISEQNGQLQLSQDTPHGMLKVVLKTRDIKIYPDFADQSLDTQAQRSELSGLCQLLHV